MRASSSFLTSLVVICLAGSARAGQGDPYAEHLRQATALYDRQQYEAALAELKAAYDLYPLPRLLYNFGQIHRKLGHAREAVEYYQLFLRTEPNLQQEQRAEVERRIAELRPAEGPRPPQLAPRVIAPQPAPALALVGPAPAPPHRPIYRRWWFWGAIGAVAAGTVAGVVAGTYHPAPGIPMNIPFHTEKQ